MQLTNEQLAEIESLSGIGFLPGDIAIILGLQVSEFLAYVNKPLEGFWVDFEEQNEAEKAMHRGRLMEIAKVRKAIFEQAKAGSSPAQTMALHILKEAEIKSML